METDGVSDSQKLGAGERAHLTEEIQELRVQLNRVQPSTAEIASTSSTADVRRRPAFAYDH
jgi:ribonuclease HII